MDTHKLIKADYDLWLLYDEWTPEQAASLLLGYDPKSISTISNAIDAKNAPIVRFCWFDEYISEEYLYETPEAPHDAIEEDFDDFTVSLVNKYNDLKDVLLSIDGIKDKNSLIFYISWAINKSFPIDKRLEAIYRNGKKRIWKLESEKYEPTNSREAMVLEILWLRYKQSLGPIKLDELLSEMNIEGNYSQFRDLFKSKKIPVVIKKASQGYYEIKPNVEVVDI